MTRKSDVSRTESAASPGERLKLLRESMSVRSMRQMAKKLGLKPDMYQKLENGTRGLNAKQAQKIAEKVLADGVRISPYYLMFGTGSEEVEGKRIVVIRALQVVPLSDIGDKEMSYKEFNRDSGKMIDVPPVVEFSDATYAIHATDDSMAPDMRCGTVGVFDEGAEWTPNDIVLAYVDSIKHSVIRQAKWSAVDDEGHKIIDLVPLRDGFPSYQITDCVNGFVRAKLIMAIVIYT